MLRREFGFSPDETGLMYASENIAIEKGRLQECEAMWLQCISVTGTMGAG